MNAAEKKKLQRMIDRTAETQRAYYEAQSALNEWCQEHYGYEAGDIDADEIIDAVFGGAGIGGGMTAARFDEVMRKG